MFNIKQQELYTKAFQILLSLDSEEIKTLLTNVLDEVDVNIDEMCPKSLFLFAVNYIFFYLSDEELLEDFITEDDMDADIDPELENIDVLQEAHLTPEQRLQNKIKRRIPKIKKALKIRALKNSKCPKGTSWSSVTKSCTKIDPKRSRAAKLAAKTRRKY